MEGYASRWSLRTLLLLLLALILATAAVMAWRPAQSALPDIRVTLTPAQPPDFDYVNPTVFKNGEINLPSCGRFHFELSSDSRATPVVGDSLALRLSLARLEDVDSQSQQPRSCEVSVALQTSTPAVVQIPRAREAAAISDEGLSIEAGDVEAIGVGRASVGLRFWNYKGQVLNDSTEAKFVVRSNRRAEDASDTVSRYASALRAAAPLPSGGLERDSRVVLKTVTSTTAVNLSPGLSKRAGLKLCMRAAAAAESEEVCETFAVVLNQSQDLVLPIEAQVDKGEADLIYRSEVTYQIDGKRAELDERFSSSSLGKTETTTTQAIGEATSHFNATATALGGGAGILVIVAAIAAAVTRSKRASSPKPSNKPAKNGPSRRKKGQ